jgi:hypothetical protein
MKGGRGRPICSLAVRFESGPEVRTRDLVSVGLEKNGFSEKCCWIVGVGQSESGSKQGRRATRTKIKSKAL